MHLHRKHRHCKCGQHTKRDKQACASLRRAFADCTLVHGTSELIPAAAPVRSGAVEALCCGDVGVAASQDMHAANMCREPIGSQHKR